MSEGITVNITSDVTTRKGAYADLALVTLDGEVARLDFVSRDVPSENRTEAVLTSRVYMTTKTLRELRRAIDECLSEHSDD